MHGRSCSIWHLLTTALLVASVSVCCCSAHVFLSAIGGGGDADASNCATSCCAAPSGDSSDAPVDEPGDDPTGCQSCCIKGSGLKDGSPTIPALTLVAMLERPVMITTLPATEPAFRPLDRGPPDVAAPTLWRLRCVLLV